jgi:hypothetical protein
MFSKAFGADYGVSRRASITIVVIPKAIQGLSEAAPSDVPAFRYRTVTGALDLILQDVQDNNYQHRAVVRLAFGLPPIADLAPTGRRIPVLGGPLFPMYEATQALINAGVVVTTASGNFGLISAFGVSDSLLQTCETDLFLARCQTNRQPPCRVEPKPANHSRWCSG